MAFAAPRPTRATSRCLALLAACVAVALVHGLHEGIVFDWGYHVLQTILPLGFLVAALRRAVRHEGGYWWLVTVFAALFAAAQFSWTFTGGDSGPTSMGSLGDHLYAIGLPFGVIGLLWLTFGGLERSQRARVLTDAWIVGLGLSLFIWVWLFETPVRTGRIAGGELVNLAYPYLDVAAAAIIITTAIYQPHRPRLRWVSAVVLVGATSDAFTALLHDHGRAHPGPLVLALWTAGPALLWIATARDDAPEGSFPVTGPRRHLLSVFIGLGVAAVLWVGIRTGRLEGVPIWMAVGLGTAIILNQSSMFTELKALVLALSNSEQEFRLAFEGAPVGIVLGDHGVIRDVNPAALDMIGLDRDTLIGLHLRDLVSFGELEELTPDRWTLMPGGIEGYQDELQWTRPDGVETWIHLTIARLAGEVETRAIGVLEDVTERRANHRQLAHMAVHDVLTGLPNRAGFMAALHAALQTADGTSVAVAFLDLDRFKVINDSVGHHVGDRLLTLVADRITDAIGDRGLVARFAGDEFTILVLDRDRETVRGLMCDLLEQLARPVHLAEGMVTYPTASIGISWSTGEIEADQILAKADVAMYRAKERGRNRVEMYDDALGGSAETELRIISELHRALDEDELRVFYQPIVDIPTGVTTGYEALVRWQHPERGLLGPAEFIDAAEESGLIVPIGEWVLHEALGQLASWRDRWPERELTMSVNLAARQVTDSLTGLVADALRQAAVPPGSVWLELTETALMSDPRNAEHVLQRLVDLGVHIAVDDFGTGYSSLSYLQRFPVAGIKVDRSFVAGLGRQPQDDAICDAVVSLGRALGLKTIAEGIESRGQLERLSHMGCHYAQGFLFSRPKPAEEIDAARGFGPADDVNMWAEETLAIEPRAGS